MVKRLKAFCQKRPFVCIAALAIPLFLAATAAKLVMGKSQALFVSDGFYYYAYTVSLALDQDVNFANQYQFNQGLANRGLMKIVPQTGYPENWFAIGAGLVWLPAFFVAHLIVMLLKAIGLPLTTTGFEVYYQLPTYLWNFAVGLAGMWLTYRLLRDFSGDSQLAGWGVATLLFGTTLSYYAFMHCNFAHWVSTAAVALCLWTVFPLMQNPERSLRWFLAGLALGGAALVRWQSVALGALAIGAAWQLIQSRQLRLAVMNCALYALGALIAFTPQLGAWHIIYGTWLTIPQGSDFMQWTSPRLMYALFSLRHGLFVWSPILLLAVWGLLKLKPSHLRWSVLLALALQIYINSCTRDFAGIGLRRMVDYTPLFAVGLVVAFMVLKERGQRHLILLASVAAITLNWAMTIGLYLIQWLHWGEFHFL